MIALVRGPGLVTETLKAFKTILGILCKMLTTKIAVQLLTVNICTTYCTAGSAQISKYQASDTELQQLYV